MSSFIIVWLFKIVYRNSVFLKTHYALTYREREREREGGEGYRETERVSEWECMYVYLFLIIFIKSVVIML